MVFFFIYTTFCTVCCQHRRRLLPSTNRSCALICLPSHHNRAAVGLLCSRPTHLLLAWCLFFFSHFISFALFFFLHQCRRCAFLSLLRKDYCIFRKYESSKKGKFLMNVCESQHENVQLTMQGFRSGRGECYTCRLACPLLKASCSRLCLGSVFSM